MLDEKSSKIINIEIGDALVPFVQVGVSETIYAGPNNLVLYRTKTGQKYSHIMHDLARKRVWYEDPHGNFFLQRAIEDGRVYESTLESRRLICVGEEKPDRFYRINKDLIGAAALHATKLYQARYPENQSVGSGI